MIHNIEAEMGILGACVMLGKVPESLKGKIGPRHFFREAHRELFKGFCEIGVIDFITMGARWTEDKIPGGPDYIMEIASEYGMTSANIDHHTKIVLDCWAKRQYVELGKKALCEDSEIDDLRVMAEGIANETLTASQVALISRIGLAGGGKASQGVPTGFSVVDDSTASGGWPKNQTSLVVAYTGVGKSTLMIGAARHAAKTGRRVLYATFADLSASQIEDRIMRQETGFARLPHEPHFQTDWEIIKARYAEDLHIDVYDAAGLTSGYDVETFCAWLEGYDMYEVVFVDYAQKLRSRDKRVMNEVSEATCISQLLARTARRLNLPIVIGSQITEGKDGGRDVTKGARAWEEDAGLVLKVKRDDEGPGASIKVDKNRFGMRGTYNVVWNKDHVRFEEAPE